MKLNLRCLQCCQFNYIVMKLDQIHCIAVDCSGWWQRQWSAVDCDIYYIVAHCIIYLLPTELRYQVHFIASLSIALVCRQFSAVDFNIYCCQLRYQVHCITVDCNALLLIAILQCCWLHCFALHWNCIGIAWHCCRLLWLAPRRRSVSTSWTPEHASAGHANSISWGWWWWWPS